MRNLLAACIFAIGIPLAAADANAGTVIDFTAAGIVLPGADCPPPPAVPYDCTLTALGTYTDSGGVLGPWSSTQVFSVFTVDPISSELLRNAGVWSLDDTSAANNDLFGTFTGFFNQTTFAATLNYVIVGGSGVFAGATGSGQGQVQVLVGAQGFEFTESGRFVIPLPGTLSLLGIAALPVGLLLRRRRAATPKQRVRPL